MRIRFAPLVLALAATAVVVAAAVAVGETLMSTIRTRILRGGDATQIGIWIAIAGGLAAALIPAIRRRDRAGREDSGAAARRDDPASR